MHRSLFSLGLVVFLLLLTTRPASSQSANQDLFHKYSDAHTFKEQEVFFSYHYVDELRPLFDKEFIERVKLSPQQQEQILTRFDLVFRKLRQIDKKHFGAHARTSPIFKKVNVVHQAIDIKQDFARFVTQDVLTKVQNENFNACVFRRNLRQNRLFALFDFYELNRLAGVQFQPDQINKLLEHASELDKDYVEQRRKLGSAATEKILGAKRVKILENRFKQPIGDLFSPLSIHRLVEVANRKPAVASISRQFQNGMEPREAMRMMSYLPLSSMISRPSKSRIEISLDIRRQVGNEIVAARKKLHEVAIAFEAEQKEMGKELIKREAAQILRDLRAKAKKILGEKLAKMLDQQFDLNDLESCGGIQFIIDHAAEFNMYPKEVSEFKEHATKESQVYLQQVEQLNKQIIDQLLEHIDPAERKKLIAFIGPDYYKLFGEADLTTQLQQASKNVIR